MKFTYNEINGKFSSSNGIDPVILFSLTSLYIKINNLFNFTFIKLTYKCSSFSKFPIDDGIDPVIKLRSISLIKRILAIILKNIF